ncbi:efflux RND transporter periplasmic adaptor subunit [Pyrinomonas sp.]|uniref:efflux RND transporter periplasmic adaptor subunit n=1 Tax=Pyrinomonas sp. TaxID=2080306 RepID=UPI003317BA58
MRKIMASWTRFTGCWLVLMVALCFSVRAHEGEDHGAPARSTATAVALSARVAERNVQTPVGQFRFRLRQTPPDPRVGEETQFEVEVLERVEGGFGSSEGLQPAKISRVVARIAKADGTVIEPQLDAHEENRPGVRGVHYVFGSAGEYKISFDFTLADGRSLSVDFPVSVVVAPINWTFWLVLGALFLLSASVVVGYHVVLRRRGVAGKEVARRALPVSITVFVLFIVGAILLARVERPRQSRATGETTASAAVLPNAVAGPEIVIPKESQLLFGIRTAIVEERPVTAGLKVTGVVRARPNSRATIAPPVSGRVFFKDGLTLGSFVARGERIGTVEQILGASEQAGLEAQRTELQRAVLEQQAKRSEQEALAQQARARLAQAERELRRATELLEVGAVPRKRVEEAQTAVQIARQEVIAAEQQARIAAEQVRVVQTGAQRIGPVRRFPLIAPVTGVISDVKAATGQQVEAGSELLNVVDLSVVYLEARVFEGDLAKVRDARQASYTTPAFPDEVFGLGKGGGGRIVAIGTSVDPQTRSVPVIFEVANPANRLRDGMFVEIVFDVGETTPVLAVPKRAVITEEGRTYVFVFNGSERFEKRAVLLGAEGRDFYAVKSGLNRGERVVVDGVYQLRSARPG